MKTCDRERYGGSSARFIYVDWGLLRAELLRTRPFIGPDNKLHCEIWKYEFEIGRPFPHVCSNRLDANETLYMRNDFPPDLQWYLRSLVNCSLVCNAAHNKFGHTQKYRAWLREQQVQRFGRQVVDDYLLLGPNRVKDLP